MLVIRTLMTNYKKINNSFLIISIFSLSVYGCSGIMKPPAIKVPDRTVELKVLKVLNAKDDDATSVAYVLNWNGQDIVVPALSIGRTYEQGDTIKVLVRHRPSPTGSENDYRVLDFSILP